MKSLGIESTSPGLAARNPLRILIIVLSTLAAASPNAAGAVLKLGDILVAEPGTSSVSVIDPATGARTVISQGGLLSPANKTVGVALGVDGYVIVVHRFTGLIRVNPVTGAQSILSQGGLFRDPWAIAINKDTGDIYVADSGYDNDRPEINQAGRIIRVNPVSGAQELIAAGSPCTVFPANAACQNATSAGSYLAHPYGIAVDYAGVPGTLVVTDMSSFNGKGAIIRIQPLPNGTQTLLWGPASAVPPPQVSQISPLGCPMGVTVEPNGNLLTTVFTFPTPPSPTVPPPPGTFYGCAPPGIFRVDLTGNVQTVVNANAPEWQPTHAYAIGDVIRDDTGGTGHVHRVVTAGVSQSATPAWNSTSGSLTIDGTVVWQNIGPGANWLIPFGLDTEPAPTQSDPTRYNIIVGDEGYSMVFRLDANGQFIPSPGPLAIDTINVTSVDVITFTPPGGFLTEPVLSNGQPTGTLALGTTQATLSLQTNVNATCRYSTVAGVAYASMPNTFATTGSTTHSTLVTGLTGGSYNFYVRCSDAAGNANADDFVISFSVAQQPSSGPVAAYAFDEGSGTSLADASGNGHTGGISGASWSAQGRFGNALGFDGLNDWVTVGDANALDFTSGMTLEAWVFPTANGGGSWRNVMIKERAGGEVYNLYANTDTNAPTVYVVRGAAPDVPLDARGSTQLPLNTWSHLAVTFDNATLRIFANGVQVGSRAVAGPLLTSTGALRIGGNSLWGEFFAGRIDEVRLYNRALTQAEIQSDMSTPIGVDAVPPVRSNGQPSGTQPAGTIQATLSLATNENATCRFGPNPGVAYGNQPNTFSTTGGTAHSAMLSGLTNGITYTRYVRCQDASGNANGDDFIISFTVANPAPPDTTPPTIAMTAPAAGTVSGNVTVSATANDNIAVVGVQFLLDGQPLGAEDTTAPYSIIWTSSSVPNGGPYQLSARARDAATNQTTATAVSVTVNNTALPGLVAAYSFSEGSGTTLADRTGLGHTGTLSGATWTTQGRFGNALSFDGVNDWVTIADATDLDFTTGLTLEAWVFPTANGGGSWRNVIIKERPGGEVYNLYANADTNAPTIYVVRAADPAGPLDARGSTQLPLNTWTHLAVTFDNSTLRIFVNGVQVGTRAVAGPLLTSTGALRLGGNGIWGEFFAGRIDEVRLYNRALSAAEIQIDMAAPVQP
jgi:hypothetical protein